MKLTFLTVVCLMLCVSPTYARSSYKAAARTQGPAGVFGRLRFKQRSAHVQHQPKPSPARQNADARLAAPVSESSYPHGTRCVR
jgi:hypothetical protein